MGFLDKFKDIIRFEKLTTKTSDQEPANCGTCDLGCDLVDLSTLKVTELKAVAKERGHKGYSTLKKAELINLLDN
jgi:hypothetical protein